MRSRLTSPAIMMSNLDTQFPGSGSDSVLLPFISVECHGGFASWAWFHILYERNANKRRLLGEEREKISTKCGPWCTLPKESRRKHGKNMGISRERFLAVAAD